MTNRGATGEAAEELRHLAPDVETLARRLAGVDYLVDEGLATSMFLSLRLPQPLLLEGAAGAGKTEAGKALPAVLDTPRAGLERHARSHAPAALDGGDHPRPPLTHPLPRANAEPPAGEDPVRPQQPI